MKFIALKTEDGKKKEFIAACVRAIPVCALRRVSAHVNLGIVPRHEGFKAVPEVADFFSDRSQKCRALTCGEFHDALGSAVPEDM